MASDQVRLSVLDLVTVGSGQSSREALLASTELARAADRLGYHRYWVAEHHNMPGVASTSPAVLLAHLAAATSTIRLGSGGVMLPNHPPLVVAEQFALLEALHPGRIDLGIGRAPGTDQRTAQALRRSTGAADLNEFASDILDVLTLMSSPAGGEQSFAATPQPRTLAQTWVLGSSDASAVVAAALGLPYAFAHHFGGGDVLAAVSLYRQRFTPSASLPEPYVLVTAAATVAATEAEAARLALPGALAWADIRRGVRRPLRSVAEAEAHTMTAQERALVEQRLRTAIVGTPETARAALLELAERTGADELMLTTQAHDSGDRIAMLELLGRAWQGASPEPVRSS